MPPTRFLLTPVGSFGDVDPFIAVGLELKSRNHEVLILANETYRSQIESLGLSFVRVGTRKQMRQIGTDPRIHDAAQAWKLALKWGAVGMMRETFEKIKRRKAVGQTVIVSAIISFGSRIASETFGIPIATLLVDPDKLRGDRHSPVMHPLVLSNWVPAPLKRLQYWCADRLAIDPVLKHETNKFRAEHGLPPVQRLLHRWCFSPELVIGLFDEWFAPPSPDWPPNVHMVGPTNWNPPGDAETTQSALEFVEDGDPPIAFIAGSAGAKDKRFFQTAVESSLQLNRRAIFLHRSLPDIPKNLPAGIRHFRYYTPLNSLLKKCCALVHHGGTGTAAHAMSAGIPQLVSPQAFDQPDIAARLQRLGLGRIVKIRKFTTRRVTSTLRSLLNDKQALDRCQQIAKRMQSNAAVETACDLLEQLSAKRTT